MHDNWLRIRDRQVAAAANMEQAMIRTSKELHIAFASLTPAFESAAKDGLFLYYPFDSHWNTEGRQIAATVISRLLTHDSTIAKRFRG